MDHTPLLPGDQANPMRGDQSLGEKCGSGKVITPGTSAMELNFCAREPTGMVTYSYRTPRFRVRLGRMRKSSLTNAACDKKPKGTPLLAPTLRSPATPLRLPPVGDISSKYCSRLA